MKTSDVSRMIDELAVIINEINATSTIIDHNKLEYRVYYNADGGIITYTTEELPGNYIVITREQWAEARPDARIIDGKLVYTHIKRHVFKLDRVAGGKYRAARWDVNILSDDNDEIFEWDMKAYDIRR